MKKYFLLLFATLSLVTFGFADCDMAGDINDDDAVNVLDIVVLANYVLSGDSDTPHYNCPLPENGGDLGPNGPPNILDIVELANCILAENCNG
ncbi:MAG: hypothetical protein H8E85_05475 [Candidatus Marinimicrobia bacterium]|nr:hypothetical protein [Candidatus Neomarinimicrobiota bacterium]